MKTEDVILNVLVWMAQEKGLTNEELERLMSISPYQVIAPNKNQSLTAAEMAEFEAMQAELDAEQLADLVAWEEDNSSSDQTE